MHRPRLTGERATRTRPGSGSNRISAEPTTARAVAGRRQVRLARLERLNVRRRRALGALLGVVGHLRALGE